jgi:hypothetical protein
MLTVAIKPSMLNVVILSVVAPLSLVSAIKRFGIVIETLSCKATAFVILYDKVLHLRKL